MLLKKESRREREERQTKNAAVNRHRKRRGPAPSDSSWPLARKSCQVQVQRIPGLPSAIVWWMVDDASNFIVQID